MKKINSPIFGKVILLEEEDVDLKDLEEYIHEYPVNAFGIINKKLNARGLCCKVDVI